MHVQEALEKDNHSVPSCCGTPLPRNVLETVLTSDEVDLVLQGSALQSPSFGFSPDSGYGESGKFSIDLSRSEKSAPSQVINPAISAIPPRRSRHQEINVDLALANEALKSVKAQQKEQFERVAAFEGSQRKALTGHHQCSLKRLDAQLQANRKEREEQVGLSRAC